MALGSISPKQAHHGCLMNPSSENV